MVLNGLIETCNTLPQQIVALKIALCNITFRLRAVVIFLWDSGARNSPISRAAKPRAARKGTSLRRKNDLRPRSPLAKVSHISNIVYPTITLAPVV